MKYYPVSVKGSVFCANGKHTMLNIVVYNTGVIEVEVKFHLFLLSPLLFHCPVVAFVSLCTKILRGNKAFAHKRSLLSCFSPSYWSCSVLQYLPLSLKKTDAVIATFIYCRFIYTEIVCCIVFCFILFFLILFNHFNTYAATFVPLYCC